LKQDITINATAKMIVFDTGVDWNENRKILVFLDAINAF
jgi:hypothetical protein